MMDNTNTSTASLSDDALIRCIGAFVRHHRLQRNIKQQELAQKAGINRTTLSDLELGRRCQLITLIQVLRILDQLHVLEVFEVQPQLSPMLLAQMELKKRKKASRQSTTDFPNQSDW